MRSYHITTEFSATAEPYAHPNSPREPPSPSFTITPEGKVVKCVGNYVLGKKLGRGAFCKVKVATHMQTGCKYAIKILKPNAKKSSWVDIEREIRVLCGLKHPNVIGLHDVLYMDEHGIITVGNPTTSFESAKKVYLVVDLAGNGELFDYIIKRKRLSEDEARWVFRQIVSAVEYLHAHCIAHRDLKPENILMDSTNTIKINDFGLSNFVNPDKKMKTFCGSPVYAAPEVMRKSYYDGVVADVWSLGVILFTMVTGCLPWKLNLHNNRIENVEDLLAGRFDIPSGVSTECATLLCKMLVPNPSQRARLNEVRKHPWVNIGYLDYPARYLEPNAPVTEIDKVVLKQMEAMGYMQARVSHDVFGNKLKPSVTIYHTLLRRRNLMLLLNSTPAVQQQPQTPPAEVEVQISPSKSAPPKPTWKPLDTVYEEPDLEPTPPSAALPSSKSLAKWVKDLTSVKTNVSDVDFHETRVAIPTAHGLSNFLKRRHSVPETQQELRTMNELPKANSSTSPKASNAPSTPHPLSQSGKKEKEKSGIIQRMFSRRSRKATAVGVFPAA